MTGLYNCQSVSKADTWRHFAAASHRRRRLCLRLLWPRCSHWCFILSSASMVYGERGDMRQASPLLDSNRGSFPLFGGWVEAYKSESQHDINAAEKEQKREPQRGMPVWKISFPSGFGCIFQLFHLSETLLSFFFFFFLLIFAIFSHFFITNWKKKRQKCR